MTDAWGFSTFNFMKTLTFFILFFLGCAQIGMAQCTVSLGEDIHLCSNLQEGLPPTALGNQLVVSNGTAPYIYAWSIEPIVSIFGHNLHASTFLDDTTLASPTLISLWEDSMTFFLRVKDANQQVCYDTIIVSASLFGTHLGTLTFHINAGDSVLLFGGPNVTSNYPIDSLVWRPSIGLSDSIIAMPMASPPSSQAYRCVIWDSQGCYQEGSSFQTVIVSSVGIAESAETAAIRVYAQQQEIVLHSAVKVLPSLFELWDARGRLILRKEIRHSAERIPTVGFENGVYFYSVRMSDQSVKSGKLLLTQ